MADDNRSEVEYYNLEGGPRHLVWKDGCIMAVAPGLRLMPATEEEKLRCARDAACENEKEPVEYGLPV